ncbi:hypothetical protein MTO96_005954 [Rhipicephalus appendiculatus]
MPRAKNNTAAEVTFETHDTQYRPILTYECYRTDVTIEPEGTVNFTILWDGTVPSNETSQATTWYAPNGTRDQYTSGSFDYEFDIATWTIKVTTPSSEEELYQLQDAYNGLAYYWKLTITSDNNRVVYKIYDVDSRCGNAAALLKTLDRKTKRGGSFDYEFDTATSTIKLSNPAITSDNNRVVYKIYDLDSRCGNAAALLRKIDQKRKQGFIFSRDVPEPKRQCSNSMLCAK